jgi:hypothetical protein
VLRNRLCEARQDLDCCAPGEIEVSCFAQIPAGQRRK